MPRVALFLDVENLYNGLKNASRGRRHPGDYGESPSWVDFGQLVAYIENHYGTLAKEDFIAVANFSHYNAQWGGLNRYATLVDAQSFYADDARRHAQPVDGKKYVIEQFADMRLALELGRHLATNPAEIYILGSSDDAFVALGRALREEGRQVFFLVADTQLPIGANIRAEFSPLLNLRDIVQPPASRPTPEHPPTSTASLPPDEVERFCETIRTLRRTFSVGVPVRLVEALYGPRRAAALLRKAQGQGKVDLWEAPQSGVRCISLQSERLYGKPQPIPTRPSVTRAAEILYTVALIGEQAPARADHTYWRQALREHLGLSTKQAKALLKTLMALGILRHGAWDRPRITLETASALERALRTGRGTSS